MSSHAPREVKLPGTSTRRRQGPVERYAAADLRELRSLGMVPPAAKVLEASYRALARQLDDAMSGGKTWDVVSSSKELRSVRAQLLAEGGYTVGTDEIEAFLASLPETPRGNPT